MKVKDLIKYFFSCGAIIYTIGSTLILLISLMLASNPDASVIVPKPFLLYLAFSYTISLGNTIFKIEKISSIARRIIHFLMYVIALFAFLMLCGVQFASSVIASAVLAVIYVVVILITKLSKGGLKIESKKPEKTVKEAKKPKKTNNASTYTSRFS